MKLSQAARVVDTGGRLWRKGVSQLLCVALLAPGPSFATAAGRVATSWSYDSQNRLASVTATHVPTADAVTSFGYTLGPAGNRVRIDELGGVARHFGYDALSRLVSEEVRVGSDLAYRNDFGYDPVGNRLSQQRTSETGSVETVASSYDSRDRLLASGATSYGWNAAGNLVARGGDSFGWDAEDRLIEAVLGDGTVVRYGYDDDGVRVRTETFDPTTGATSVVDHLVDTTGFLSQVVAETDGDGQLLAHYVRGDDLLAVIRPTGTRFYHADGLGSIRALTDEAGQVTDRYDFEAFGTLIAHQGDDPNAYLFAGEPLDPNSRFAYHRARWMDPEVGRFVSVDPFLGFPAAPLSLNVYLYGGASPQVMIDPTGLVSYASLSASMASLGSLVTAAIMNFQQGIQSAAYTFRAVAGWRWSIELLRAARIWSTGAGVRLEAALEVGLQFSRGRLDIVLRTADRARHVAIEAKNWNLDALARMPRSMQIGRLTDLADQARRFTTAGEAFAQDVVFAFSRAPTTAGGQAILQEIRMLLNSANVQRVTVGVQDFVQQLRFMIGL